MQRSMPARLTTLGLAVTAILMIGGPAAGQNDSDTTEVRPIGGLTFEDEFELTVVNLLVYVTDRDGNPITDLEPDDFRVFQDGELREITNFELYTKEVYRQYYQPQSPVPVPVTPTPTAVEADGDDLQLRPIWMVLYVDHQNLHPLDRNRVLKQLRDFVRENLQPPVQMMVISRQREAKVVQDFTSDPSLVLEALRGMRRDTGGRPSLDRDRKEVLQMMEKYREDPGASTNNSYRRAEAMITSFAEQEMNELSFTLSSLREVTTMLAGLPGKKAILYLSNGLPMIAGQDLYYALANVYDEPSAITGATRYDQSRNFRALAGLANAQDVTFYTIDASGLEVAGLGTAEYARPQDNIAATIGQQNYQDSLRYVAETTGGLAIINTNDVSEHLHKIEADFYTYYSLGYPLVRTGGDKVHEIEVELRDDPELDDYRLRYRRRFVEKSLESQVRDKVQTGLVFPIKDNPMQVEVATGNPAPASAGRWTVPMEVSFPIETVALLPEGDDYVGRVVLFAAARDVEGKQSDIVRQEHEIRIPAGDYDDARSRRFTVGTNLLMETGSYTLSVGLMDQVTRVASYQTEPAVIGP
jgi:VWFA-related protein